MTWLMWVLVLLVIGIVIWVADAIVRAGEKQGKRDAITFLGNLQSKYPSLEKLNLVDKALDSDEWEQHWPPLHKPSSLFEIRGTRNDGKVVSLMLVTTQSKEVALAEFWDAVREEEFQFPCKPSRLSNIRAHRLPGQGYKCIVATRKSLQ